MKALVRREPVTEPVACSAHQDYAHLALRCVLDAEIEALEGRLQQASADSAEAGDVAGAEDCPLGWLRDSLAKLQARRDALS